MSRGPDHEWTRKKTRHLCTNRACANIGLWMVQEVCIVSLIHAKPMALYRCWKMWSSGGGTFRLVVNLPTTRWTNPPDKKRGGAERHRRAPNVTMWPGGSTRDSTRGRQRRNAIMLIQFHGLSQEVKVRAAAGGVCSSLREELVNIRKALGDSRPRHGGTPRPDSHAACAF